MADLTIAQNKGGSCVGQRYPMAKFYLKSEILSFILRDDAQCRLRHGDGGGHRRGRSTGETLSATAGVIGTSSIALGLPTDNGRIAGPYTTALTKMPPDAEQWGQPEGAIDVVAEALAPYQR